MTGKTKTSLFSAFVLTALFLILTLLFNCSITAQEYSKLDSLKPEVKYKIILFDDTEVIGKLISHDSLFVIINTGLTNTQIRKDDIFNVSKNLTPSKYRFIFSAGGGISFLTGDDMPYKSYSPMFNLSMNAAFIASISKGYRLEVSYSRFKKKKDYQPFDDFKGGDMGMFYIKTEFMMGILKPSSPFSVYGTVGLGIHITKTEEYSYKVNGTTVTVPEDSRTNAAMSIGGGLGYRFNNHYGFYTEIQYNIVTNKDRSFLFGLETGYFPVRAGLTYYIY